MGQDQQKNQMIMSLAGMLKSAIADEKTGAIKPEFKEYEPQLQQVEQILGQQQGKAMTR